DQIEALEDESELVQAQPGEAGVVELGGCLPVDADHARGGDVDAADEVEKGGLPRARRGGDRRELSFAEGEGDSIESPDLELAEWVFLDDVFDADDRRHRGLRARGVNRRWSGASSVGLRILQDPRAGEPARLEVAQDRQGVSVAGPDRAG